MSLVKSWSSMGRIGKSMKNMKELDSASITPTENRQAKTLQGNLWWIEYKIFRNIKDIKLGRCTLSFLL